MKFNTEDKNIEYKAIQKIRTGDKGFKELARECVAFANAQGGKIYIGIENKTLTVGPDQVITIQEQNDAVSRIRSLCFSVAITPSDILSDENGSQYFIITVLPSIKTIASTSDGKLFVRIVDKCEPVRTEDIQRLAENYHLIDGEKLTNLGVLWIGTPRQRAGICYPLTVQYIVYNALEEKVRKEEWHELTMNPKELLLDIEQKAPRLPDAIFLKVA